MGRTRVYSQSSRSKAHVGRSHVRVASRRASRCSRHWDLRWRATWCTKRTLRLHFPPAARPPPHEVVIRRRGVRRGGWRAAPPPRCSRRGSGAAGVGPQHRRQHAQHGQWRRRHEGRLRRRRLRRVAAAAAAAVPRHGARRSRRRPGGGMAVGRGRARWGAAPRLGPRRDAAAAWAEGRGPPLTRTRACQAGRNERTPPQRAPGPNPSEGAPIAPRGGAAAGGRPGPEPAGRP